jgi:uncharacterized membrane protein
MKASRTCATRRKAFYLSVIVLLAPLAMAVSAQRSQEQAPAKMQSAPRYELIELPLRPIAIANSGWIAGMAPDQKAALLNPHRDLIHIALPPEFTLSEALSVNSKGEAVGYAVTADSAKRVAFLFRDDKVVILPGEQARAYSINEAGEIAGQAKIPGQKIITAVLWKAGSLVDLKICCAGTARAINQQSVAAGDVYDDQGRYHAFLWDSRQGTHRINLPSDEFSSVLALNDRGQALLRTVPGGLRMFTGEKFESLDLPFADPRSLNGNETVVGSFGPHPEAQKAFVWDKIHGLQDLNKLIPPNSGWDLEVASSINSDGEIVGWGDHGRTVNAGFLLRPINRPNVEPAEPPKNAPRN